MDGSQGIAWTEDENGVRVYFGPRWTEDVLAFRRKAQAAWSRKEADPNDAHVWTPNGMRPR